MSLSTSLTKTSMRYTRDSSLVTERGLLTPLPPFLSSTIRKLLLPIDGLHVTEHSKWHPRAQAVDDSYAFGMTHLAQHTHEATAQNPPRIEVHLYGALRSLVPGSRPDEDTVMWVVHVPNETFEQLTSRMGLTPEQLGDCFIDGTLARKSDFIPSGARVALFPYNMVLLCGGQHLKGHGYTRGEVDVDYY